MLSDEQIIVLRQETVDKKIIDHIEAGIDFARAIESAVRTEYAPLYRYGCELLAQIGMHGKLDRDAKCVDAFKSSMDAIDGGTFNEELAK